MGRAASSPSQAIVKGNAGSPPAATTYHPCRAGVMEKKKKDSEMEEQGKRWWRLQRRKRGQGGFKKGVLDYTSQSEAEKWGRRILEDAGRSWLEWLIMGHQVLSATIASLDFSRRGDLIYWCASSSWKMMKPTETECLILFAVQPFLLIHL